MRLLLVVLALFELAVFPLPEWTGFGATPAFAADQKGASTTVRRRRRRAAPKEAAPKEITDAPFAVAGQAGFDHGDFDKALKTGEFIDAVMLIDSSRSMKRTDPNRLRDQGAKLFLRFLTEGDRVAVVQFDRDTKILSDLVKVNAGVLKELDATIEQIPAEGNFTDLWSPVLAAAQMLREEGRKDSKRAIVLLSDGKMDPDPTTGVAQDLVAQLLQEVLPGLQRDGITLYTLALSPEADKALLAKMAEATGGLYWYAPDVDSIHKKFSDLFLTLKKPQMVELTGEGFEIDPSTTEATFYLTRPKGDFDVRIVDPTGRSFNHADFPPGIKWFRGDLFDVVTIPSPLPGKWTITGLEDPEGFATLLTDLKLQARWPGSSLRVGDTALIMARLIEKGETFSRPEMKDILFYTYKIVDSGSGQVSQQGTLNDKGEEGDERAGDGIYSALVKLDQVGEYRSLIAVTGPTFSRQQLESFVVSSGMITLNIEPEDEFTGTGPSFRITLSPEALKFTKRTVQLVDKRTGEEKARALSLEKFEVKPGEYLVPAERLGSGEFEVHARVSGFDPEKKPVKAASETILYTGGGTGEGQPAEDDVELVEEQEEAPEESGSGDLIWAIVSILLSGAWTAGASMFLYKRSGTEGKVTIEARPAFVLAPEIAARVEALRARSSETKRPPNADDARLFALILGGAVPAPAAEEEASDAPAEEQAEAAPEEETSEGGEGEGEGEGGEEEETPQDDATASE